MAEPASSIVGILNLQSPLVVFFREKREVQACGGCYLKQEIWKGVHQLRSPAFLPAIPFTIYNKFSLRSAYYDVELANCSCIKSL
jgi:hypothetical protein